MSSRAIAEGGPVGRTARAVPLGIIPTTWRSYVAELPAWLIVAGALAVSFWTQVETVGAHRFAYWEALVWGSSTDAGTVAFLFLAREGAHRGTPTWGAWLGSIACAFMSVQFNVVPAVEAGDWLAVEAHLWMPALALGTWYWMLHGRHRRWNLTLARRIRNLATMASVDGETPQPAELEAAKLSAAKPRRNSSNGETRPGRPPAHVPPPAVTEVVAGMRRDGQEVTPRTLAARLGVSERSARRYLATLPRVVGE